MMQVCGKLLKKMKKIRFDTRDTKPKLYNLLIITVAAVMISALTVIINPGGGAGIACCITSVYCLIAAGILFYSFREQMRYNPYSYNTIFYFGFAVFALFVAATHIYLAVRIFSQPEVYTASAIIHTLLDSAKNYMIVTAPFVFAFSAALCVSNLSLIVHEGFRPADPVLIEAGDRLGHAQCFATYDEVVVVLLGLVLVEQRVPALVNSRIHRGQESCRIIMRRDAGVEAPHARRKGML